MNATRLDLRNAAGCAAAVIAAILLAWPIAELPFNDDFSYSFTVKRLCETGRICYNGWSSPLIITQAYWGAFWVWLFGSFSFTVLRLSMMPLAAGSAAVTYLLARRCGLRASASIFCALLLGVSPLFLPLAASFMNDVPGCFCMLPALYALVRCVEASGHRCALGWLCTATVVSVIGGLSRQSVWIVPIILLPYTAWR